MRVMVILKATRDSEAGVCPKHEVIARMIGFNEEMTKAGILKAADGIKPSRFGKRINYRANRKPVAETMELIAGFWIWEV